MEHVKEFARFVIRGLPLLAVVILATLLAVHLIHVLPPVGVLIVFIAVFVIASAAIGIARDIIEGD